MVCVLRAIAEPSVGSAIDGSTKEMMEAKKSKTKPQGARGPQRVMSARAA